METDPVTGAPVFPDPPAAKAPAAASTGEFGQILQGTLRAGPKLSGTADPYKSLTAPPHFMPLNRSLTGTVNLSHSTVEALGATTKHPLGPVKR